MTLHKVVAIYDYAWIQLIMHSCILNRIDSNTCHIVVAI